MSNNQNGPPRPSHGYLQYGHGNVAQGQAASPGQVPNQPPPQGWMPPSTARYGNPGTYFQPGYPQQAGPAYGYPQQGGPGYGYQQQNGAYAAPGQPRPSPGAALYGHEGVAPRQPDPYPNGPVYRNQQQAHASYAFDMYGDNRIGGVAAQNTPAADRYEAHRPTEGQSPAARRYQP